MSSKPPTRRRSPGVEPTQTLTAGALTYTLDQRQQQRRIQPNGLNYNTGRKQFTANVNGAPVTYTVSAAQRHGRPASAKTRSRHRRPAPQRTFTDTVGGASFVRQRAATTRSRRAFPYDNHFFIDALNGITYLRRRTPTTRSKRCSYLPETTQLRVHAGRRQHVPDPLQRRCAWCSRSSRARMSTPASRPSARTASRPDRRGRSGHSAAPRDSGQPRLLRDQRRPVHDHRRAGGRGLRAVQSGGRCSGAASLHRPNTFKLSDPGDHLHAASGRGEPAASRSPRVPGAAEPRPDLGGRRRLRHHVRHRDDRHRCCGQGQAAIPITNSAFTLSNPFDTTEGKVHLRRRGHLQRRFGRGPVHRHICTDVHHRQHHLHARHRQSRRHRQQQAAVSTDCRTRRCSASTGSTI